ncbi:hypothetical protein BpHYR1_020755 [Brachionus plicatilis]|uniref:Uncharacterized protein n=1 Tax=Brachionus plicatilis TaxID=10195 RepID=A0A3M7SL62_BRAPC|nr:hypothetical protein BpHYR1_020755 [Brachionus plicatilis]
MLSPVGFLFEQVAFPKRTHHLMPLSHTCTACWPQALCPGRHTTVSSGPWVLPLAHHCGILCKRPTFRSAQAATTKSQQHFHSAHTKMVFSSLISCPDGWSRDLQRAHCILVHYKLSIEIDTERLELDRVNTLVEKRTDWDRPWNGMVMCVRFDSKLK